MVCAFRCCVLQIAHIGTRILLSASTPMFSLQHSAAGSERGSYVIYLRIDDALTALIGAVAAAV
jgi:hypothetical protein